MTNEYLLKSKFLSKERTTRLRGTGEGLAVDFFHLIQQIQRFQKVSVRFDTLKTVQSDPLKKR